MPTRYSQSRGHAEGVGAVQDTAVTQALLQLGLKLCLTKPRKPICEQSCHQSPLLGSPENCSKTENCSRKLPFLDILMDYITVI